MKVDGRLQLRMLRPDRAKFCRLAGFGPVRGARAGESVTVRSYQECGS